jgi:prevent-host-death family protein
MIAERLGITADAWSPILLHLRSMRIPSSEVRRDFSDVLDRAGRGGERIEITHYGTTLAVLLSKSDLAKLQACDDRDRASRKSPRR